nr:PsbP domain-containing protein 3, chloroplastic [Ipomoea batatas]
MATSLLHSQCGSFLATAVVSRSATGLNNTCFVIFLLDVSFLYYQFIVVIMDIEQSLSKRRELLLQAGIVAFSLSAFPSVAFGADNVAVKESPRVYSDDVNKFKILIPADWEVGTGEGDGVRSLIAFYPQEASNSNVSIVITSLGADFTRLESFGKVDEFAENLVSGLDRSWKRPPGVAAKLIDSKSANGLYYIDYTLQNPGQSLRHLFTVLGIANNGFYNRLYTITGQFVDEEAEKYGAEVEKAVASFRLM